MHKISMVRLIILIGILIVLVCVGAMIWGGKWGLVIGGIIIASLLIGTGSFLIGNRK